MDEGFEEHNREVRGLMSDFRRGAHKRVPVSWSIGYKVLVLDPRLNKGGYTFEGCFSDPMPC